MEDKQARFLQSKTKENLMRAFAGESQAASRYTIAAGLARKQEQKAIENLFLFTAGQERTHASLFYHAMEELSGQTIHVDGTYPVDLYPDLLSHLKAAQHNEEQEWHVDYARFAQEAREEEFPLLAKLFTSVADVERVHSERFGRYARQVERGEFYLSKEPAQWICLHCGLVVESTAAPAHCALCRAPQGFFFRRDENPDQ